MRKHVLKVWDLPSNGAAGALIIIAVMFFIGGLAGCTLVGRADGGGEAALSSYLDGFLNVAESGEIVRPTFVSLLWKAIRWPLFALFLGFTPLGLICIPALFLIRSFLLSFSISSFFYVLGTKGLLFAFSVFGITSLVYIPILFVLGIQGFLNSGMIIGRMTGENGRGPSVKRSDFFCFSVCFLILLLCCFIEYSMGSAVLKTTAEILNY